MSVKWMGGILMLVVVVSLVMAVAFMRIPALWPLMPAWLIQGFMALFDVRSQEQAANVEFLSAWVLCFGFVVLVCAVAVFARRIR